MKAALFDLHQMIPVNFDELGLTKLHQSLTGEGLTRYVIERIGINGNITRCSQVTIHNITTYTFQIDWTKVMTLMIDWD